MVAKILEIDGGRPVVNHAMLCVPEFVGLMEYTADINAFMALWAMYDPESPYFEYDDIDRAVKVKQDYPGDFYSSYEFNQAKHKAEEMYNSTPKKLLMGAKSAVEKLSSYLATTEIEHGRDGNVTAVVGALKAVPSIIQAYSVAEQAYKQEIERSRGQSRVGVDEDVEDDY
jgi:hypothetical protein